jgi:hypothetical protein
MAGNANDDGVAIGFVILFIVLLLVAGLFYYMQIRHTIPAKVVPVSSGTCTCSDITDLENRLNVANAAIAEYQNGIQDVNDHDATVGKPTMYNEVTYAEERANVQIAINAVLPRGAPTGTGDTTTDCETVVKADTPCLQGSVQTHENVHSANCQNIKQQLKDAGKLNDFTNYKDSMTMVEYWNDEIAGYQAEIAYINTNLATAKADASCKWACDVDHKTYDSDPECERSCRPTLGSNIDVGLRCRETAPA